MTLSGHPSNIHKSMCSALLEFAVARHADSEADRGYSNYKIIKALLKAGASRNSRTSDGKTPYDLAKIGDRSERILNLLKP